MFGLTKLFNAVNALAGNVLALSGTVAEVNGGLRRRLALDGPEGAAQLFLDQSAVGDPRL